MCAYRHLDFVAISSYEFCKLFANASLTGVVGGNYSGMMHVPASGYNIRSSFPWNWAWKKGKAEDQAGFGTRAPVPAHTV